MKYSVRAYVQLDTQICGLLIWLRYNGEMIEEALTAFDLAIQKAANTLNTELISIPFSQILHTLEAYQTVYYLKKQMLDNLVVQAYIKAYHEQQHIKHIKLICGEYEKIISINIHPFFQRKVC